MKKIDWLKVLIWFIFLVFVVIVANLILLYFEKPNLFDLVTGKTYKTNDMTEYVQIVDAATVYTFRDNEFENAIQGMKIKIIGLDYLAGKGTLSLVIEEDENYADEVKEYEIDDISGKEEHLLIRNDYESDLNEIVIPNFSKSVTELKLKLYGEDKVDLASFSMNLSNKKVKEIASLKEAKEEFSTQEFLDFLSELTILRYYEDNENRTFPEDLNTEKVIFTGFYQTDDTRTEDGYSYYDKKTVHEIIKEIFGDEIEGTLSLNKIMTYDSKLDAYRFLATGRIPTNGKALEIKDISLKDDVYKVKFTYCYPERSYNDEEFKNTQRYEMTVEFKKLDNWKYKNYQLVDFNGNVIGEE
jgi:hypothetical protein